jgi:hypothetical protein
MVEKIVVGTAMAVAAVAAAHRFFRRVDDEGLGDLGAAFAFVRPVESFNACLFGERLARRTQLLAFCFRGVVVGFAPDAQNHTVNICANVLGNRATLDVGGDAVGVAEYRIAITAPALPAVIPDVAGQDWAANVLAD